ncbi:MAG: hypothetical protein RL367_1521 [Pseudomonadota bacterium]
MNRAQNRRRATTTTLRRLVVLMMATQLVSIVLALALMYSFMRQTIVSDARAFVALAQSDLSIEFRDHGPIGLNTEITARLSQVGGRDLIVLLRGPDGRRIGGNLAAWPATIDEQEKWRVIQLYRQNGDAPEKMGLVSTRLPGGYSLITGQVLEAEDRLTKVSERALFWSLLLGLVMTGLIMFFQEHLLARRIGDFTQTADAIQQGDLTRRVEPNQSGDAFDRLARSINAMLARIEGLVAELRIVTDVMAHDLRSPVSRLKAGLERAINQTSDETAQVALGEAIGEADRLNQMLNTALQISRAEAGMGRDQFSRFAVDDLLGDAAEVYGPLAEERGFVLVNDSPAQLFVRGHRDLLMQAISNLIDNALGHGKGGDLITITTTSDDRLVTITVADNGPGIALAQRAGALKRFGRLDAARGTSGAGLGLSLVETIAHLHDGTLELATADGGGLCAILRLGIAD